MTFKEKLTKEHPDNIDSTEWGGCRLCPCTYGYESRTAHTPCINTIPSEKVCTQCWNREIPGTEENKTSSKIADDLADVFHGLLDRSIEQEKAYHIVRDLINRGYFDK